MMRHYQQMKCQKYTSEQLLAAIQSVKEHGAKVTVTVEKYHVPLSTLYDHKGVSNQNRDCMDSHQVQPKNKKDKIATFNGM